MREFVLAIIEDALDGDPEALKWIADRLEGFDAFGPPHTHGPNC